MPAASGDNPTACLGGSSGISQTTISARQQPRREGARVNGLEIGFGVLYLGLAGLVALLLIKVRNAPRGGQHLPGRSVGSPRWQLWKVVMPLAIAVCALSGVLWLLRGLGRVH